MGTSHPPPILSAGFHAVSYGSTRELLDADILDSPNCLILDVRMPGASGLDLQRHLAQSGNPKPIIFLTGHGDIPMAVQAMKTGAVDFLTKPVRDQTLLDVVTAGVAMDAARRAEAEIVKVLRWGLRQALRHFCRLPSIHKCATSRAPR